MINARSETAHEKRSFRSAFQKRRCVIPADGYFEWKTASSGKQPYLIERRDGGVLAMAGLWEANARLGRGPDEPLETCTVLTTDANETTRGVHDRMPVFLDNESVADWLSAASNTDDLRDLMRPAANELLKLTPVSKQVGNPKNDDPECVRPIELPSRPKPGLLFDLDE